MVQFWQQENDFQTILFFQLHVLNSYYFLVIEVR
jgi:hypothetical protein